MHTFEVRLFGEVRISHRGRSLPSLPTRGALEILAFLLINRGQPVARDRIACTLWGGRSEERAKKALRTGLWRLRTHLEKTGTSCGLRADRDLVVLVETGNWWVDLWTFEDTVPRLCEPDATLRSAADADELRRTLDLHPRPFLETLDARWCESRRERARLLWLSGMETLVAWYRATGDATNGLLLAQQVLQVAPLRETMHRELMTMHYLRGDRPSALLQYERYRELLRDELGVSPMASTRDLHDRILRGSNLAPGRDGSRATQLRCRTPSPTAATPDAHDSLH